MNIVVLLIVLLLLFGGGGFYLGGPAIGGGLGGLILLVLIVMFATGRLERYRSTMCPILILRRGASRGSVNRTRPVGVSLDAWPNAGIGPLRPAGAPSRAPLGTVPFRWFARALGVTLDYLPACR
jgi:hypothetical protein